MRNIVNINAAGSNVRCDHDGGFTGFEASKSSNALPLALIAVNGDGRQSLLFQMATNPICTAFCAGEDDSPIDIFVRNN